MSAERLRSIYLLQNTGKRDSPFVNTHFMAEMRDGILVAVTDYQSFDGDQKRNAVDEEESVREWEGVI